MITYTHTKNGQNHHLSHFIFSYSSCSPSSLASCSYFFIFFFLKPKILRPLMTFSSEKLVQALFYQNDNVPASFGQYCNDESCIDSSALHASSNSGLYSSRGTPALNAKNAFHSLKRLLNDGKKIILCTMQPSWNNHCFRKFHYCVTPCYIS